MAYSLQLVLHGVLLVVFLTCTVLNYLILFGKKTSQAGHSVSLVPLGGLAGMLSFAVSPWPFLRRFIWLPMLVDPSFWGLVVSLPRLIRDLCTPVPVDQFFIGSAPKNLSRRLRRFLWKHAVSFRADGECREGFCSKRAATLLSLAHRDGIRFRKIVLFHYDSWTLSGEPIASWEFSEGEKSEAGESAFKRMLSLAASDAGGTTGHLVVVLLEKPEDVTQGTAP